jgi:hypothetical protein
MMAMASNDNIPALVDVVQAVLKALAINLTR